MTQSALFTTLISDVVNSYNLSASASLLESYRDGSVMTYLPLQVPPLAIPTFLADTRKIGRPNLSVIFTEVVSIFPWIVRQHYCFVVFMVRGDVSFFLKCMCLPSLVMLFVCRWVAVLSAFSTLALWHIVGLVLGVSIWSSLMVTCHPLVMLCLSMTLRSSSASLMAALMVTSLISLFLLGYLFIWLLFFSWGLMATLTFKLISVFVV